MSSELETTSFFDSDEDDSTSRWGFGFMRTVGQVSPAGAGPPGRDVGFVLGPGALQCLLGGRTRPAWWGTTVGPTGSAAPPSRAAPHA